MKRKKKNNKVKKKKELPRKFKKTLAHRILKRMSGMRGGIPIPNLMGLGL